MPHQLLVPPCETHDRRRASVSSSFSLASSFPSLITADSLNSSLSSPSTDLPISLLTLPPNWPPHPPPIGPSFEAASDPSITSLGARGRRQRRPQSRPRRRGAGWPALPCQTRYFHDPKSSAKSSAKSSPNSCIC